jgi:mannose/cellobiose epimerase-like protein (N-acyl-D-glucosamine 2-epimerase family)
MQLLASIRDGRQAAFNAAPPSISAWLKDVFLPAWIDRALDGGHAGYVESVPINAQLEASGPKSTMVAARLAYTFCLGHLIDDRGDSLQAAEHGLRFLLDDCRLNGRFRLGTEAPGWVSPQDADLYTLAFVLLALGGHAAVTGRPETLGIAETVGTYIDTLHDGLQGGYREPGTATPLRQQFPNMHLFEAFQLLDRLAPSGAWRARAETVVDLVEQKLIAADGSVSEWYQPDWQPLDGGPGSEREIGHQFEWAWLLYRHAETSGSARAADLADRLFRFGCRAAEIDGTAPVGLLLNAVDRSGQSIDNRRPLWPLTELLRAAIAGEALGRPGPMATIADQALEAIFVHFVDPATGLWINERDDAGSPLVAQSPTRVLYHLLPAFIAYAQAREPAFVADNPILDRSTAVWQAR